MLKKINFQNQKNTGADVKNYQSLKSQSETSYKGINQSETAVNSCKLWGYLRLRHKKQSCKD